MSQKDSTYPCQQKEIDYQVPREDESVYPTNPDELAFAEGWDRVFTKKKEMKQ